MSLIEEKYDNLDFNRKKIYKDYYDCALIISNLTELLINSFNDELIYLQPVFLEYSYDKDTYRNYKILLSNIRKQTLAFENKILITRDNRDYFSIDTQKILCIGNQIKVYINNVVNLLSQTDNPDLNDLINIIFQDSINICTNITHYTRQCRLDKKLFSFDNEIIPMIIQKRGLFEEEIVPSNYDINDCSLDLRCIKYKEELPKNIKVDINKFLKNIDSYNSYGGTSDDAFMYRDNLSKDYNKLIEMIKVYIVQTKKLVIIQLMKIQEYISYSLLDYSIPNVSFKKINSNWAILEESYNGLDKIIINKNLKDVFAFVKSFENISDLFNQFIIWFNTAESLEERIMHMQDAESDLKKKFDEYNSSFELIIKILECYESEDYEQASKYEEELEMMKKYKYVYNN